jgi:hypothetical protein
MKKTLSATVFALAISSAPSYSAVISMGPSGNPAFATSSNIYFLTPSSSSYNGSGYESVANATSSNYVAYNANGAALSTFTWANPGTFDLNNFSIAGAWGTQTLTISGFNGASLVNSSNLFVSPTASLFTANWTNLTSFTIATGNDHIDTGVGNGSGKHWALNDITVNSSPSAVPVPAAALLFGPALLGFMGLRRKAKKAVA